MESVINVGDIDSQDRQALEHVLGQALLANQQLVIQIVNLQTPASVPVGNALPNSEVGRPADIFAELSEVWTECQQPNWDGHQARPITHDTWQNAHRLLETLPPGSSLPSIGAEADGDLTLEWHREARRTLSVSVTAGGELHYAALLGPQRHYGTVPFMGQLPDEIAVLIERVTSA